MPCRRLTILPDQAASVDARELAAISVDEASLPRELAEALVADIGRAVRVSRARAEADAPAVRHTALNKIARPIWTIGVRPARDLLMVCAVPSGSA